MTNDHDRALALAECIAAAWGIALRDIGDGLAYGRSDDDDLSIVRAGRHVTITSMSVSVSLSPCPWQVGLSTPSDAARARIQAADLATDGLISHRLRQAGETDWLAWLWPETSARR